MQTSGGGSVNDEFRPVRSAGAGRPLRRARRRPAAGPEVDGLAMTLHDEAFRLRADNDLSRIDWLYADSAA
jgi:hypothetical protein